MPYVYVNMVRGFVIITDDAEHVGRQMTRLRHYGVQGIEVAEETENQKERFLQVAKTLGLNDKLVVCSLHDVCHGIEELLEVLVQWTKRQFDLVSLDEPWVEEYRTLLFAQQGERLLSHIAAFTAIDANNSRHGRNKIKCPARNSVKGGRPKGSIKMNAEKLDMAVRMYCQGHFTVRDICDIVRCNERSMYRYLKLRGVAGLRRVTGTDLHNTEVKLSESEYCAAPEN